MGFRVGGEGVLLGENAEPLPLDVGPQNFVSLGKEFGKETEGNEASKYLKRDEKEGAGSTGSLGDRDRDGGRKKTDRAR